MARQAKQSRPQVICVLADNSGSMHGEKAQAATEGIRELVMECQSRGPRGPDKSYFRLAVIRFADQAELDPLCNMTPVRQIDPDLIEVRGDGGGTNIRAALELALSGLQRYMRDLREHPERAEHPLPVVLLFSDGHNGYQDPRPLAQQIRGLNLDGDPVVIATAGVSVDPDDTPDENLLRELASPGCYMHITDAEMLRAFISAVGSSGASRPADVAVQMRRLKQLEG